MQNNGNWEKTSWKADLFCNVAIISQIDFIIVRFYNHITIFDNIIMESNIYNLYIFKKNTISNRNEHCDTVFGLIF